MTSEMSPSPGLLFSLLRQRGFHTSKRLGQNFLTDENLLARIADMAGLGPDCLALEIGPGPGTLTTTLAPRAGGVVAVELDERLREFHAAIFGANPRIEFVYGDALRLDIWALARERAARRGLGRIALVGNLPFQITSPLLFAQADPGAPWFRMALMVQKEVADRLVASPGGRDYGALTVKLRMWWRVTAKLHVPAGAFTPRPNVDATTLAFEPMAESERPAADEWPGLSGLIDAAFNQRRKKLYNSISERWPGAPSKDVIRRAIDVAAGDSEIRAESLSTDGFRTLYRELRRQGEA